MPKFLEDKLRAEYGNNPHAIYGTMNKIGAMRGNKITAKGKAMQKMGHDAVSTAGFGERSRLPDTTTFTSRTSSESLAICKASNYPGGR